MHQGTKRRKPDADRVFQALGDPTRRFLLERLSKGPISVSQLAEPLDISLAAVVQHVDVLENSGLVQTRKEGRTRMCHLNSSGLSAAEQWIQARRSAWERKLDRLAEFLSEDEQ